MYDLQPSFNNIRVRINERGGYPILEYRVSNFDGTLYRLSRKAAERNDRWFKDVSSRNGVYFYIRDVGEDRKVYIGKSIDVGNRRKQHANRDDWDWTEMAFFHCRSMTEEQMLHVERIMIGYARKNGSMEVLNTQAGNAVRISESDREDAETTVYIVKRLMFVAGYSFLQQKGESAKLEEFVPRRLPSKGDTLKEPVESVEEENENEAESDWILYLRKDGKFIARGIPKDGGILVLKGSRVRALSYSAPDKYRRIRKDLNNDGSLKRGVFQCEVFFKTPTEAASTVLGESTNGLDAWRNVNGKRYRELFKQNGQ